MSHNQPQLTTFISSMIGPLWDERAAVEEAIRTGIPLARVRECDIYLLILGKDINDPVKDEYRTAVECDKPQLCFVQEGVEPTPALK